MTEQTTQPAIESQPEFDTTSALADISAELFGQGEEGRDAGGKEPSAEGQAAKVPASTSTAVEPTPPAQTEKTAENSSAVQAVGAPETWTKEAIVKWATIDPTVQQEILKREQDIFKGIEEYKGRAEVGDKYSQVVAPYKPILDQEGIDPVQMFQNFTSNHYLLSRGTPEQKTQLGALMVQSYGLDLVAIARHLDAAGTYKQPNPEIQSLQAKINELEKSQQTFSAREQEAAQSRVMQEVNDFAKDPAHPYFDEVVDDIVKFISSGVSTTLQDAYDKAVYANTATRRKELDRLKTDAENSALEKLNKRGQKVAAATAADLRANPKPRSGATPTGTMDETMAETLAAIKQRS